MTTCTSCIHCLPFTERFCNDRGRPVQKWDNGTLYCHAPQYFRGLKPDPVTGGYVFDVDGNKRPKCADVNRHGECRMFEEIEPMESGATPLLDQLKSIERRVAAIESQGATK